ncbi:hypothetical protein BJX64DRAFT_257446 [Aspergillus heterothallicus]
MRGLLTLGVVGIHVFCIDCPVYHPLMQVSEQSEWPSTPQRSSPSYHVLAYTHIPPEITLSVQTDRSISTSRHTK